MESKATKEMNILYMLAAIFFLSVMLICMVNEEDRSACEKIYSHDTCVALIDR